jgi:uncharacterized protein (TIGR02996 family)
MNDNPLIAAMNAMPDDDVVRLVYSDWLLERDQPERAELIRLQIEQNDLEVASGFPDPLLLGRENRRQTSSSKEPKVQREQFLLAKFGERWKQEETNLDPRTLVFYRGFPAIYASPLSDLRRKRRLNTVVPLDELRLTGRTNDWTKLNVRFEFPPVSSLVLDFPYGQEPSPADVERIVSYAWPRVRFLHLRPHALSPEWSRSLADGPFRRLEGLSLPGVHVDGASEAVGWFDLFDSIAWLKVVLPRRTTDLFGAQPEPALDVFRAILCAPQLGKLRHLVSLDGGIGAKGAEIIAANANRWDLRSLALAGNELNELGAALLFRCPGLRNLERLDLADNGISDVGFVVLASSPHMERLTHIDMARNFMTDVGALALASSSTLNNVRLLRVGASNMTDQGKRALKERFGNAVGY